jgi:hypothetical protein
MTTASMDEYAYVADRDWSAIDGELCRVTVFTPMASVTRGNVIAVPGLPYASVTLEPVRLGKIIHGFISHKTDFRMLWAAFRSRGAVPSVSLRFSSADVGAGQLAQNEEVWVIWSRRNYRTLARPFARFLPRLIVMVSPKGAFDLVRDGTLRPDLQGEARFPEAPLVIWTPQVMKT